MNQINFDILDYMGKINDGVLTLISLNYEGEYYQGTFYYTKEMLALTVEESLEDKLGSIIEEWPGYQDLMLRLIKRVIPLQEIITRVDDVDIEKWMSNSQEITYVESEDGPSATQSSI